jgi:nitroimidazol reductase NimA-like FMN-containing flavoprotein (pyridoxamine 5'-phosphate oxidase superfamily)
MDEFAFLQELSQLFASQTLAVLSTQWQGQPYASLVAFASTSDLKSLTFATSRSTRKYANLQSDPRAAMLIDNRSNRATDLNQAKAVTAIGHAERTESSTTREMKRLYLSKHPYLEEFLSSENCALFELVVQKYILVSRFQQVVEMDMHGTGSAP